MAVRGEEEGKRWEARISCGLYRPVEVQTKQASEWFGEKEPSGIYIHQHHPVDTDKMDQRWALIWSFLTWVDIGLNQHGIGENYGNSATT